MRQEPEAVIPHSLGTLDLFQLSHWIGWGLGWPKGYDVTKKQWAVFERQANRRNAVVEKVFRNPGRLTSCRMSPIDSYPRALIRLAFLPKALRDQVMDGIARVVGRAIQSGHIPAPRLWKPTERRRGSPPVWQRDDEGTQRFLRVVQLKNAGWKNPKIAEAIFYYTPDERSDRNNPRTSKDPLERVKKYVKQAKALGLLHPRRKR